MQNKELWQAASGLIGEAELAKRFKTWISNLIRVARMKAANIDSGELFDQDIAAILGDLNKRTKSRFQPTDAAKALIIARLKQGYQVQDFIRVHEVKCLEWLGNEKMEHNLRPSTLYAACHFDEYLSAWWKLDRERQELAEKRAVNKGRIDGALASAGTGNSTGTAERQALIAELCAISWDSFASWGDFMRHTCKFPDAAALREYPMPQRIRTMRSAPINSMIKIYSGQRIEELEAEYQQIKAQGGKDVQ